MHKAWYILNYHDISWEDSAFTRAIGGTFPPDIFEQHVNSLKDHFRLVSVQQGLRELNEGIREPILSFWFDDGFLGVRKYAFPILQRMKVAAATSVNSSFMLRTEFFWRLKLSYLTHVDGLRFVRSGLRKIGVNCDKGVRNTVMSHFSVGVRDVIDQVYLNHTSAELRDDAWRLFDDVNGLRYLHENDWVIANHSASHYPVSESSFAESFADQFQQCESELRANLNIDTDFWVMPFDRPKFRAPNLDEIVDHSGVGSRHIVFVGNELNQSAKYHRRKLFRIFVPTVSGADLITYLGGLRPHAP
jgi:hypothetical protein